MNKNPFNDIAREEAGYTLVEVLTALVILFIVFLPVSRLCSQLLSSPTNRDRIVAINLAEAAMNRTTLSKKYQTGQWTEKRQNHSYVVDQKVDREGEALVRIEISVFSKQEEQPLVTVYTFRPVLGEDQ